MEEDILLKLENVEICREGKQGITRRMPHAS